MQFWRLILCWSLKGETRKLLVFIFIPKIEQCCAKSLVRKSGCWCDVLTNHICLCILDICVTPWNWTRDLPHRSCTLTMAVVFPSRLSRKILHYSANTQYHCLPGFGKNVCHNPDKHLGLTLQAYNSDEFVKISTQWHNSGNLLNYKSGHGLCSRMIKLSGWTQGQSCIYDVSIPHSLSAMWDPGVLSKKQE